MRKLKKILLVMCLVLCVMLAGTACGKNKNKNTIDKNTIYKETDINLQMGSDESINSLIELGDRLAFIGYRYDDTTYTSTNFLLSCKMDGSDVKKTDITSDGGNSYLENAFAVGDKLYCVFTQYTESWEGDVYSYYIDVYDKDLNKLKTFDLSKVADDSYINLVKSVGNENLLIATFDKWFLLDGNFNLVKTGSAPENGISNIVIARDGRPIIQYWGTNGYEVAFLDLNKMEVGEKVNTPNLGYNYSLFQGRTYDMLFLDSNGIYGFNIGDTELTPVMNYINSDLSTSYFDQLVQLEDGSFIGTYYDWLYEDYTRKLCRYTKVDPAEVKDKQIITLGCLYMSDEIRKQVLSFNKNSDEYRITVKDYSQYENEDNWNAGTEKMNSDIASGQSPDIIIADNTATIGNYISKGLFTDLNKYIEKDEEINKEDLFPNLLEATSYKGKLYAVVPYFYIDTLVGKTSNLGGRTSWTMQEMLDYANSLPEGTNLFYGVTRDSFLTSILEVNSDYFVNASTGQCHFDSQEFIQILEFCKTLPAEINYDNDGIILYDTYEKVVSPSDYNWEEAYTTYRANKTMLSEQSLSSFYGYKYTLKGTFGEDITCIGYPSAEGTGSCLNFYLALAISSKCANPEGAWQFVRHFLTDEYQMGLDYGFPASMKAFDELGAKAMERSHYTDYETGEEVYYDDNYWMGNDSVPMELLTEQDITNLKNVILATNKIRGSVTEVLTIIEEESQAFFEGQKSAEEVAKIIQSRATIYISEKQ